jgi:hypothetical protein
MDNKTKISPFKLDPIVEKRPKIEEEKAGKEEHKNLNLDKINHERPSLLKSLTEVDKNSEKDEEEKLVHTGKKDPKALADKLIKLQNYSEAPRSDKLKQDSDDSSGELPNENNFNYKVDDGESISPAMGLVKKLFVERYKETFTKMKEMNKQAKQRIERDPIWEWEKEESSPDALSTGVLRVLSVTWNMNAKKPQKDITGLLRPDIKHDLITVGSEE